MNKQSLEFMNHPKVQEARRLIIEAEKELYAEEKSERGFDLCSCKHRRSSHGKSYNINYTNGVCAECDCMNYLHQYTHTFIKNPSKPA